ncbi:MAG: type III pantothenate kinase [Chloroflexi bacterium]|nr:type III pantothenate kinase [Chloroflexota bacterium]
MDTLLAVDIGNTQITIGAFQRDEIRARWRVSTDPSRTEDEHALIFDGLLRSRGIDPRAVEAISLCSVVPPATDIVVGALRDLFRHEPLVIGRGTKTGIRISYDRPQDVGADRIVDAVAVFNLYPGSSIVVDFGTATVFDAVSGEGEYLGGAIAPGIMLAAEALYQRTSQLRRVELRPPEKAIGRNTTAAMQSGLLYGYVALVEGMVARFQRELGVPGSNGCNVVATGGLAELIARETDVFTAVNPDLTLVGLKLLYDLNS